jgi:hypothetical protein
MPRWLQIVLIVVAVCVLFCGLGVGAVAWWFNSNKDQLKAKGERVMGEAQAFAQTSDSAGCLKEALARLERNPGFMDEVEHRVFLGECLRSAPRTATFCDGVPPMGEIMKAALWSRQQCESYAGPKEACGRMMQEVMTFCERTFNSEPKP